MPATVLIADDEPHMLRLIEFTFRKGGYDLVLARNGREAVDLARVHLPGLVVLDMQMPEMDGLTALKTLKADPITAGIPVILLSARGHLMTRESAQQAGLADVFIKPFSPSQLLSRVQAILAAPTPTPGPA